MARILQMEYLSFVSYSSLTDAREGHNQIAFTEPMMVGDNQSRLINCRNHQNNYGEIIISRESAMTPLTAAITINCPKSVKLPYLQYHRDKIILSTILFIK